MKVRLLATLLALAGAAAFWLSSAASPSHAPARDPVEGPLPPEAFAQLDFDTVTVEEEGLSVWLYNGSDYAITSLDFDVEIRDFPWKGNEHNSREWLLRGGTVRVGGCVPRSVVRWWVSTGIQVDPAHVQAKVVGAEGFRP